MFRRYAITNNDDKRRALDAVSAQFPHTPTLNN
jgi:hypothetical protein